MSCDCPCHLEDDTCMECCDGGPDAVTIVHTKGGDFYEDKYGEMVAKLKRFEEREPLVQELLAKCDGVCNSDVDPRQAVVAVLYARDDVRYFKLT